MLPTEMLVALSVLVDLSNVRLALVPNELLLASLKNI